MELELTLGERFALIGILPAKGNCITLERARELHKRLVPTPTETEKFKITDVVDDDGEPTGDLQWPKGSATVEAKIEIGETMNDAIKATLTELDTKGELTHNTSPLYRKFVKAAEPVVAEKPADTNGQPKGAT